MSAKGFKYTVKAASNAVGSQRNATLNFTRQMIDISTKDSQEDREFTPGTAQWSVDFDGLYVPGNTGQDAFRNALSNGSTVTVDITTGTATEYHWQFTARVSSFEENHAHEDASLFTCTAESNGDITFEEV